MTKPKDQGSDCGKPGIFCVPGRDGQCIFCGGKCDGVGVEDRFGTWACINCRHVQPRHVCSYWFGVNEVGPFCESCDELIKQHVKFRPQTTQISQDVEQCAAQLVDTAQFLRRCRGTEPSEHFESHAIECERASGLLRSCVLPVPVITAHVCGGAQSRRCRVDGGEHDMSRVVRFKDGGSVACSKCGITAMQIHMMELP